MNRSAPVAGEVAGKPALTQFLDADAQLRAPLPDFARQPEVLRALYRRMVETRIFDKTALALQRDGQLEGYAAFLGQEAIVAAVATTLRPDDILVGSDRGYTLQRLSGASLLDVLRHWSATQNRPPAVARQQFTRALEIAATLQRAPAARIALARSDDHLADCEHTAGPSLTDSGLPLIIIAPRRRPPASATDDAVRSPGPALARERVDGNDVLAMRDALARGIACARRGDGPRMIEALICPLADGAHELRSPAEVKAAWEHCPIKRLKRYLESRQLWTVDDEEALLLTAGEQAKIAAHALRSAIPDAESALDEPSPGTAL